MRGAVPINFRNIGPSKIATGVGVYPGTERPYYGTGSAPTALDALQQSDLSKIFDANSRAYNNQNYFLPMLAGGTGVGKPSPFGSPLTIPGMTPASEAPRPGENAFGQSLARLSKNPRFDDLTSRFLDELDQYQPDRRLVRGAAKDQLGRASELGARTSDITSRALDTIQSDQDTNRRILDDFVSRFGSAIPELDAQTKTQTRTLDRFFGDATDPNSLAAQQAGIRARAKAAEVDAIAPQIERAILASNVRSGLTGVNSVNNSALTNTVLGLARENAVRNAQREAQDLANLTNLQRSTAGLPQEIATTNLLRSKIPLDVRTELGAKELGLTGQALQQALSANAQTTANLGSGLALDQASDPLTDINRRQAVTGESQRQYLLNNFLEVAQRGQVPNYNVPAYNPQTPYYAPPPQLGGNGNLNLEDLFRLLGGAGGGDGYQGGGGYNGTVDNFVPEFLARPNADPNPYYGPGGYGGYGALRPNEVPYYAPAMGPNDPVFTGFPFPTLDNPPTGPYIYEPDIYQGGFEGPGFGPEDNVFTGF